MHLGGNSFQWGSEIRKHLRSGLFESLISNGQAAINHSKSGRSLHLGIDNQN